MKSRLGKKATTSGEDNLTAFYRYWEQHMRQKALAQGREQGMALGREQGLEQGLVRGFHNALTGTYRARFGRLPQPIGSALLAMQDAAALQAWVEVFATGNRDDIATAVLSAESAAQPVSKPKRSRPPPASRR